MARKDIWVSDKQRYARYAIIGAVALLAVFFLVSLFSGGDDVSSDAENLEDLEGENGSSDEPLDVAAESSSPEEEEIPEEYRDLVQPKVSNQCRIDLNDAEDEVKDVYSVVQKAEQRIRDLEVQLENAREDLVEATEMLEEKQAERDELRIRCEAGDL